MPRFFRSIIPSNATPPTVIIDHVEGSGTGAAIAASKMAYADRIIRVKDLQDIDFIRKKFGVTPDQILRKVFGIEIETHRRCAIMNWNQMDRLISDIPQRKAELERHMSLVDELEQKRQIEIESEEQEEEGRGTTKSAKSAWQMEIILLTGEVYGTCDRYRVG